MHYKAESSRAGRYVSGVCPQPRRKVSKQISVLAAPVLRSGLVLVVVVVVFCFFFKSVRVVLCVHAEMFVQHTLSHSDCVSPPRGPMVNGEFFQATPP